MGFKVKFRVRYSVGSRVEVGNLVCVGKYCGAIVTWARVIEVLHRTKLFNVIHLDKYKNIFHKAKICINFTEMLEWIFQNKKN